MNAENFQHKLARIRPPRVQITYDVHIGNAIEKKELPFVVGVLADLTTPGRDSLPKLAQRSFIDIDRDNFDNVMAQISPSAMIELDTKKGSRLNKDGKKQNVILDLFRLEDFQPSQILKRTYAVLDDGSKTFPLADLHLRRLYLNDIVTKLQGNEPLRKGLLEVLKGEKAAIFTDDVKNLAVAGPPAGPLALDKAIIAKADLTAPVDLKLTLSSGEFPDHPEVVVELPENGTRLPVSAGPTVVSSREATIKVQIPPNTTGVVSVRTRVNGALEEATFSVGTETKALATVSELVAKARTTAFTKVDAELKRIKLTRIENDDHALDLMRTFLTEVADRALYLGSIIPLSRDGSIFIPAPADGAAAGAPGTVTGSEKDADLIWLISEVRIAALDREISDYLNQILHGDPFKRLESAWRGLNQLVMNSETGDQLKIRLLPVSKAELFRDLERAVEPDQSVLFKKVYEDEYGTFGGNPFSVLIGAYEFGRTVEDVEGLAAIASVAASAHAPFVAAAHPGLFDLGSFQDLAGPRDLAKIFQSPALIKWNAFRSSEDARYVALTLPRYMLRAPYGIKGKPADELPGFNETCGIDSDSHNSFLWGNAAFALAQRITAAFAAYRWTAAIRGAEGGGLVRNLPIVTFERDGALEVKTPTEVLITDRREKELSDLGFISLCYRKASDQAAFFGGHTVNRPIQYNTAEANANSSLSAQLPYIMAMSRFAHYFKVMMRDKIGSFMTKENVAAYLNTWIADYVLLNDDAPQSLKASNPLREARVDVFDVAGRPGVYTAVAFLRPHFQLEELSVSMRLVATLPPPALTLPAAAPLLA